MISISVKNNNSCAKCGALLTSGMVGAHCAFSFGAEWDGLTKTAVFVAGNVQKDVLLTANECVIPWEVLEKHGYQLSIGVYGVNASGDIVIPTIYTNVGVIQKGADPNGDESTDPTLPVWAQIKNEIGNLDELETEDKTNIVNAINEAAQSGGGGGTSDHRQLSNRDAANQHPISAINGLQSALDGKQPIGDYATTQDVSDLADIVDTKADASDIPSLDGYATEQWVENKGYLTEHQSLAGYATETYVNNHHDDTKQDLISDLATIRSGAERGAVSMAEHKLTYTGTAIQLNGVTQTFAQVKSACEDASKFVYLVYESRLYIPQYVTTSAIYFTCTYPTDTMGVMTRRISMMSNGTITVNNTELAPKTYVDNAISTAIGDAVDRINNL